MSSNQRPGPGLPFQKENGKWTFYDYPKGVQIEAGEYPTEQDAKDASIKVLRIWYANGYADGPIGVID
jgi:hypothetical protein